MCDTNFITICFQIIAIFIYLIVAFIAIFGKRIKGLFYRPELNLSITSLFPDCNLTTFSSGQRAFSFELQLQIMETSMKIMFNFILTLLKGKVWTDFFYM